MELGAKAKELRKEAMIGNTTICVAFQKDGKIAIKTGDLTGQISKTEIHDAVLKGGKRMTNAGGALMGVASCFGLKNAKDTVFVFTNDGEVLRASGIIKRSANGGAILTDGEKNHIQKYIKQFGSTYELVAKTCYNKAAAAQKAGRTLRVDAIGDLGWLQLENVNRDSRAVLKAAVKEAEENGEKLMVKMHKGWGSVSFGDEEVSISTRSKYINGEYELNIDSFGRPALVDPIDREEHPEKAMALALFRMAVKDIVIANAKSQYDRALEKAAKPVEEAVAA